MASELFSAAVMRSELLPASTMTTGLLPAGVNDRKWKKTSSVSNILLSSKLFTSIERRNMSPVCHHPFIVVWEGARRTYLRNISIIWYVFVLMLNYLSPSSSSSFYMIIARFLTILPLKDGQRRQRLVMYYYC
ncbi:unnamed protein product [Onchocerca flexuosa]|uniref:Secreted protein n=1 Tax=Onchocerca flexuosa TaxID=387005 RepID=A0A183HM70_9BILA|nr:unnamed protein product [Onchocerca flexuosa]